MNAYQQMHLPIPVDLLHVWQVIRDAGHDVLFVGGCVRDLIIGEPVNDYDLATSARPEAVMALFPQVIPTGVQHGTVTVLHNHHCVEVTTFRIEEEYGDSRRPDSVSFISRVDEDLQRRDFTCNSMAYRPDCGLLDLFDGRDDLEHHRLRTVGSAAERFAEDALRMMRAVRFCAQLDLEPEPSLLAAAGALQNLLYRLSKERIAAEFSRLCRTRFISRLAAFADTGILRTAMATIGRTVADEREFVHLLRQLLPGADNPAGLPDCLAVPAGILGVVLSAHTGPEADLTLSDALTSVYIRNLRISLVHDSRFSASIAAHAAALVLTLAVLSEPVQESPLIRVRRAACRVRAACQLEPDETREMVAHACSLLVRLLENPPPHWPGLPDWLTPEAGRRFAAAASEMRQRRDIIAIIELPVDGCDLMGIGYKAGRMLGNVLESLLRYTVVQSDRPERTALLALAAHWLATGQKTGNPVNDIAIVASDEGML